MVRTERAADPIGHYAHLVATAAEHTMHREGQSCAASGRLRGRDRNIGATLFHADAADSFQIVVPVGVRPDRHLVRDPGKRDVGRL